MSTDTTSGTSEITGDSVNVDHSAGEMQGDSAMTEHNVPSADSAAAAQ
jgi:hypothetical protein